jgi:hypothetical protein
LPEPTAADVASAIQPPNGSFVFGSAHAGSTGAQTVSLRLTLTQAGHVLLRDHRGATLGLWVLYTPAGGIPEVVKWLPDLRVRR